MLSITIIQHFKILITFLIVVSSFSLVGCGGETESEQSTEDKNQEKYTYILESDKSYQELDDEERGVNYIYINHLVNGDVSYDEKYKDRIESLSAEREKEREILKEEIRARIKEEEKVKKSGEEKKSEEVKNNNSLSSENRKSIVKLNLVEGEKIIDAKISNEKITIKVNLGDPSPLTGKDLAISRFSSISDELLKYDSWKVLSVDFQEIGTITMNYSQYKNSSLGKYFETLYFENQI